MSESSTPRRTPIWRMNIPFSLSVSWLTLTSKMISTRLFFLGSGRHVDQSRLWNKRVKIDLPLCVCFGTGEKAVRVFRNATDLLQMERDNDEFLVMHLGLAWRALKGLLVPISTWEWPRMCWGLGQSKEATGFSEGTGKEKHLKVCFKSLSPVGFAEVSRPSGAT